MYAHDGGVTTASERAMRLGFTGTLGLGCFGKTRKSLEFLENLGVLALVEDLG